MVYIEPFFFSIYSTLVFLLEDIYTVYSPVKHGYFSEIDI